MEVATQLTQVRQNQTAWDSHAEAHAAGKSALYDVESFVRGKQSSTLLELETAELGSHIIQGKTTMLHLMCHIGLDTVSWKRKFNPSFIAGVDFSTKAVETARQIASQVGFTEEEVQFVQCNIYDLTNTENVSKLKVPQFDVVFTSYGVLAWLPDISKWASIISTLLKPGGLFYIAELHPVTEMFAAETNKPLHLAFDYFPTTRAAVSYDTNWSYAGVPLQSTVTTNEWKHTLSEVVNAVIQAGMNIQFLHEFPWTCYCQFNGMKEIAGTGRWEFEKENKDQPATPQIPLVFSLMAKKQ